MRSPQELLQVYEMATKESPLVLASGEAEVFSQAMKLSNAKEDARLGKKTKQAIIWDRGVSFKDDAVISPVDGKAYSNRHSWDEMLKRNGCVQVGNDFNNSAQKKREIKGDFDCHKELAKVTHQVAEKYGY